jgi:hypothetical protein
MIPRQNALRHRKRLIKLISLFLAVLTGWSSLAAGCQKSTGYEKYSYSFTGSFDTVVQIIGYTRTRQDFDRLSKLAETRFWN